MKTIYGLDCQAYCACRKVEARPLENEDGMLTDRWVCTVCGCEFVRRAAVRRLAEPEGEEPTLRSMAGAAPDLTGGVESVEWLRRKRAAMEDNYAAYATPRSRAEAEAMVEGIFRTIRVRTDGWTVQDTGRKETWNRLEYEDWQATTRAALLRALTGEGT